MQPGKFSKIRSYSFEIWRRFFRFRVGSLCVGRGCCTSSDEHLRIRWAMIAKSELQEDTTDEGARKVLHDLSWIEFLGPGEILSSRVPWHSSNPNARSLSHSPSVPPPSFTQSPYPPRSLVRDGQTSPHRPRLVVSHSTCPPLSSPPHANSFVIVSQIGPPKWCTAELGRLPDRHGAWPE